MRRILPPSDPKMFRRSAIGTGALLGTLTAFMLSFQNCSRVGAEGAHQLSEKSLSSTSATAPASQ